MEAAPNSSFEQLGDRTQSREFLHLHEKDKKGDAPFILTWLAESDEPQSVLHERVLEPLYGPQLETEGPTR